jgi:prefoldin subunit 5
MKEEKQLLELKAQIQTVKTEVAELEGTKKHLMRELLEEYRCKNLGDAEKSLKDMVESITKLSKKITDGMAELLE